LLQHRLRFFAGLGGVFQQAGQFDGGAGHDLAGQRSPGLVQKAQRDQTFLVHRGLKTLALRLERAQETASVIARWLEARDEIAWVRYPGLPSHPQHALAMRQMEGPGSMVSFEMKAGLEAGKNLMNRVRLATLAVSLGGVETLIEHPASMTHAGIPLAERVSTGITDGLVRYSVGIEDADDLIDDLRQALETC
ncbi:MAG: PLP-dependent transferase, partial [Candidatus Riflebacteria bacterium]|nr:PLP-dependent transferase [Candidatus Riflebacteria bacterium]